MSKARAEPRRHAVHQSSSGAPRLAQVSLPSHGSSSRQVVGRALAAACVLTVTICIVYLDRAAYTDRHDGVVSLLDAIHYATLTLTAIGHGDITPTGAHARILTAVVVTPLRIAFLMLLISICVDLMTTDRRRARLDRRWRRHIGDHVIVVGYGTMGRSVAETLRHSNADPAKIVIVDAQTQAVLHANAEGFAAVQADATDRQALRGAEVSRARDVFITLDRDDSTILVALIVRQLNATVPVCASTREEANAQLLRKLGVDAVVTSSEAVGRLVGCRAASSDIEPATRSESGPATVPTGTHPPDQPREDLRQPRKGLRDQFGEFTWNGTGGHEER